MLLIAHQQGHTVNVTADAPNVARSRAIYAAARSMRVFMLFLGVMR